MTYKQQAERLNAKLIVINNLLISKEFKGILINYIKQEAKSLKAEIKENGCGKKLVEYQEEDREHYTFCGCCNEIFCQDCKESIKLLNQIIK